MQLKVAGVSQPRDPQLRKLLWGNGDIIMNDIHTQLRWYVDRETGSWVLQYQRPDGSWTKVPVVFADGGGS
jgi:hypothetical protein